MGWASGSYMAQDLWDEIRKDVQAHRRRAVARRIVEAFENHDADDWDLGSTLHKDAKMYKRCGCDYGHACDCEGEE